MEYRGEADPHAQALGVGRDREHGLGRGLEQEIVDHGLVLVGDVGDLGGQREYDVKILGKRTKPMSACARTAALGCPITSPMPSAG